jgi:serine O-acetyltransferase
MTRFTYSSSSASDRAALLSAASSTAAQHRALSEEADPSTTCDTDRQETADQPVSHSLFALVRSDLRAKAAWCYQNTQWKAVLKTLLTDGTTAMICYRLMQWARRWKLSPLEMLFNKWNVLFCNCIIGRGAEFGPGFVLVHSTGVVINGQVRGGEHVYVEHQVTIGAELRQSPLLGSHVFIGAGAKIVGGISIGCHSRIGANAVVIRDVPPGATAVGVPARIVERTTSSV